MIQDCGPGTWQWIMHWSMCEAVALSHSGLASSRPAHSHTCTEQHIHRQRHTHVHRLQLFQCLCRAKCSGGLVDPGLFSDLKGPLKESLVNISISKYVRWVVAGRRRWKCKSELERGFCCVGVTLGIKVLLAVPLCTQQTSVSHFHQCFLQQLTPHDISEQELPLSETSVSGKKQSMIWVLLFRWCC